MPGADTLRESVEVALAVGLLEALDFWQIVTWTEGEHAADAVRPAFLIHDPANAPDERVLVVPRLAVPLSGSRATADVPVGIGYRGPVDGDPQLALDFLGTLQRRFRHLSPRVFGDVPTSNPRISGGVLPLDANRRPCASATILFRARMADANN